MAKPYKNPKKVQIMSNKSNKTSLNYCVSDSIGLFAMHAYAFMVQANAWFRLHDFFLSVTIATV